MEDLKKQVIPATLALGIMTTGFSTQANAMNKGTLFILGNTIWIHLSKNNL